MVESSSTSATTAKLAPSKDTRVKTSDVTNTKGFSFQDFGLSKETQLVSEYLVNLLCVCREYMRWVMKLLPLFRRRLFLSLWRAKTSLLAPRMERERPHLTRYLSLRRSITPRKRSRLWCSSLLESLPCKLLMLSKSWESTKR